MSSGWRRLPVDGAAAAEVVDVAVVAAAVEAVDGPVDAARRDFPEAREWQAGAGDVR